MTDWGGDSRYLLIENGSFYSSHYAFNADLFAIPSYRPWDEYSEFFRMREAYILELGHEGLCLAQEEREVAKEAPTIIIPGFSIHKRARIFWQHDRFWLIDLNSTRGLLFNDRRVVGPELLSPRDAFHIGAYAASRITYIDLIMPGAVPDFICELLGDEDSYYGDLWDDRGTSLQFLHSNSDIFDIL